METPTTRSHTLLEALAADQPTMSILVKEADPVPAHFEVLRRVCTCVKDLPIVDSGGSRPGLYEWDLRGLLIDGVPVAVETVLALLEVVYDGSLQVGELTRRFEGRPQLTRACLLAIARTLQQACLGLKPMVCSKTANPLHHVND